MFGNESEDGGERENSVIITLIKHFEKEVGGFERRLQFRDDVRSDVRD